MTDNFLIVDVETSIKHNVIDFSAVLVDNTGNVIDSIGTLVHEKFKREKLFHREYVDTLWKKKNLKKRMDNYYALIKNGDRIIASVNYINKWLNNINDIFNPFLTAYNLMFDITKCENTKIDLSIFSGSFCLWHTAANMFGKEKDFLLHVLKNHAFNAPTKKGNMTIKTNAEIMAQFLSTEILGNEPHTALEDILDFELPILTKLLNNKDWKKYTGVPYNWRNFQVKDLFIPKDIK